MAKFVVDDSGMTGLDQLTPDVVREIRRQCVTAGAKVVEKELKKTIEARGHVVSGAMRDSVGMGVLHEDIDRVWVEVYPQGTDPRGVENEMKNEIINRGYFNKNTGRKVKRDPYVKNLKKDIAPQVSAVISYQYDLCMKEINGGQSNG